ncbi:MAG TPA: cob(I)yrinic acid a,c-diamide adenosyltransferase, partial [Candidatus Gracilibacteria bacterium]|nr:cob(I)yrinic acid a,c-diamide adenosyltransferase [Candidatus Gracilibacteria bacterium]
PFPEKILSHLQHELFDLGADLSTPVGETVQVPRVTDSQVKQLEQWIDEIDSKIEPLKNFILPGGSASAAQLHLTRSVSRRAERALVTLSKSEELNTFVLQYLNRLSDLLFMLARYANSAAGVAEVKWEGLGSV